MTLNRPDRSNYTPQFRKTVDNDQVDLAWTEGEMSDGRPFRLELWAQDQLTCATVFVPRSGLEHASSDSLLELLESEKILIWRLASDRSASISPYRDAADAELWSINVVIGMDDSPARADTLPLVAYTNRRDT